MGDVGGRPVSQRSFLRKLLYLLTPAERRQLWLLAPAVIVMALLNTVGVASIVPFLALLSDPDAIDNSRALSYLFEELDFASRQSFFFAVGIAVLAILTLGNAFSAVTTWSLLRFSWMRNHSLAMRLLSSYLQKPYAYFLDQNTSHLSQKILAEAQTVVSGVIVQSITFGARVAVIVAVLVILVIIDPPMALGVGVLFGGVYGVLFLAVRRRLHRLGEERLEASRSRYQIAAEMLTGIKEIKLASLEQTFLDRYAVPSFINSDAVARGQVIGQLPRFALETVAFGGVLLTVLFLLRTGRALTDILPLLGLYAFASYRILPSIQQVFAGLSTIRTKVAALDALVDDLPPPEVPSTVAPVVERLVFERCLALDSVSFTYANVDQPALLDVDLSLSRGEWLALVGPTGSGKSTFVDILLGLLQPSSGGMSVDDVVLTEENLTGWQANAGYVPQQIFLADDTIGSNIAFGSNVDDIDHERVETAARVAQIHDFIVGELPDGYATRVGERGIRLSGGQRQRLGIARALYREPRFLVLDEATSALDNETEARFFTALRASLHKVTVVSIAHRLSTTRGFDRILVIEAGRVIDSGTYEDLSNRSDHFRRVDAGRSDVQERPLSAGA